MQDSYRNICRIGRKAAGMTQERWAEAVGCSVEAVRGYERGEYMPSDDLAMRMADAAGMPVLSHWHLFNKSALARELLPEVNYTFPFLLCQTPIIVSNKKDSGVVEKASAGKAAGTQSLFSESNISIRDIIANFNTEKQQCRIMC